MKKLRWINKGEQIVPIKPSTVEKMKEATYVADLCIKTKSGIWSDEPVAVFYQPHPKEAHHKHYFGLFYRDGHVYICDATSAVEEVIQGTEAEDGEIIFSRFRHDYRTSKDGTAMVDGGRDYFKHWGKPVRLKVIGPDFEILEDDGEKTAEAP